MLRYYFATLWVYDNHIDSFLLKINFCYNRVRQGLQVIHQHSNNGNVTFTLNDLARFRNLPKNFVSEFVIPFELGLWNLDVIDSDAVIDNFDNTIIFTKINLLCNYELLIYYYTTLFIEAFIFICFILIRISVRRLL